MSGSAAFTPATKACAADAQRWLRARRVFERAVERRNSDIATAHANGVPASVLAAAFGLTRGHVHKIINAERSEEAA